MIWVVIPLPHLLLLRQMTNGDLMAAWGDLRSKKQSPPSSAHGLDGFLAVIEQEIQATPRVSGWRRTLVSSTLSTLRQS